MNRIERLTGLLLVLQQGQRSAQELADRFEVSRRTILRDLDALGEMGVPIVSTPGRSGGFRVMDDFWLPPLHLSAGEATAVLLALELAGNADGESPLGPAHRSVREKIEGALHPDVRHAARGTVDSIAVARHQASTDPALTATMLSAISSEQWLTMRYRSPREETTRYILPLSLSVSGGKWYVRAVDERHREVRTFRLDRILDLHAVAPPDGAAATAKKAIGTDSDYRSSTNPEVRVELTEQGLAMALDHPDFQQWTTPWAGGALLRFHCPEHELAYYARELFRFGLNARILAPQALRQHIVEYAESLARHHRDLARDNG